ncbi:MAG: nicotinate-nucleotide adenylyltransferase [Cryomorphaceae bacterium]|nr:nicotinate-nucleotide adenylyltransferase [Cryomorphaceae bacterium]
MSMTGLFFGSFNPVHIGHLIVAQHIYYEMGLDEVWFVVSPQNPFKASNALVDKYERLHMVNLAIAECPYFKSSNLEFALPEPSYTYNSLQVFKDNYPDKSFALLIGSDSLQNLHRWKNGEDILRQQEIIVYPRPGFPPDGKYFSSPNIHISDAPLVGISSTDIRASIKNNAPKTFLLPKDVWEHIDKQLLYVS